MDLKNYDKEIDISIRTIKGEFYTPKLWVDKSHEFTTSKLGDDWYNKLVWDCAWGTGNLTSDYEFGNLLVSTLKQSDLDIASHISTEAKKFQFDFLNDELDEEIVSKLKDSGEVIFFINPPYATSNQNKNFEVEKTGLSFTKVSESMKKSKWGGTSQLYTQFFFKIHQLQKEYNLKVKICIFSPPLFLTGASFKNFRSKFFSNFKYVGGFLFPATEFNDINTEWGLSFTIWETGKEKSTEFDFDLLVNDKETIKKIGTKKLYSLEKVNTFSDYMRATVKSKKKKVSAPFFKSALNFTFTPTKSKIVDNIIGVLNSQGNNVKENNQSVVLFSWSGSKIGTIPIVKENFLDCMVNFASRRSISGNKATWYNWYDEYKKPNKSIDGYLEWSLDCVVYSLFNGKSNQSAISTTHNGKDYRVNNEFFWLSKEDLNTSNEENERFVYNFLKENWDNLSIEAKNCLTLSKDIILSTLSKRNDFHKENPQYHINLWDSGWYQIKAFLNQVSPNSLKEFTSVYKNLETKVEEGVYTFEILKK